MAVYNEILVGRFNRFLQKFLSMKGPASMNVLAPELQAQIAFASGVENRYLEGWDTFAQAVEQGALAANIGQAQLRNPTTSNVIAVIEHLIVGIGVSGIFQINGGPTTTDLGGVSVAQKSLDTRQPRNSSCLLSNNQAAAVTSLGNWFLKGTSTIQNFVSIITEPNHEIPLLPGQGVIIATEQVNSQFILGIRWRERFLEESERQ